MNYRSLLVPLGTDARATACLKVAARMALAHDAHLMGVAVGTPDDTSALTQAFREHMATLGVREFDVRSDDGEPAEVLARHGAHCDLGVFAASPSGIDVDGLAGAFFMKSGRPAVILPAVHGGEVAGRHVVVAWNGSREANRAMADALPWLRRARQVGVVCFDKPDEARFSRLELNDLDAWLRRHGVQASIVQHPAPWSVAEALSNWLANVDCDLLVMGAYGHGHLRESVLGGVTRSMLASVPVPILISG
jgi:nucleotide-binding universal stress UspA family protein